MEGAIRTALPNLRLHVTNMTSLPFEYGRSVSWCFLTIPRVEICHVPGDEAQHLTLTTLKSRVGRHRLRDMEGLDLESPSLFL